MYIRTNSTWSSAVLATILAACGGAGSSASSDAPVTEDAPSTPMDQSPAEPALSSDAAPSAAPEGDGTPAPAVPDVPVDGADDAPTMLPVPEDSSLDTDGDGLTDEDEITRHGTSPNVADTDGDGFDDHDEIVDKAFDPDTAIAQFNPRVADVPELGIELVSAPAIAVTYSESSGTAKTVGTERTQSTSNATTKNWGGSNSHSVEMTHTAGVEVGVEHEFGPTGGTTLSASLSYEFSHATTNEQTVTWSDEQTQENSDALAEVEAIEASEGTELDGGYVQMAARLTNRGHIAFAVEGITLSAYTQNPEDPNDISPMGTLTFLDAGNAAVFPKTAIRPGQALPPATFNLDLDLGTTKDLLADSSSLVIAAATGSLTGTDGVDFGLAATNINARTAQVIIDYGVDRRPESYRVAVATNLDKPLVPAKTVFEDYLRIPFQSGEAEWRYADETASRASFRGLTQVRDVGMSDADSSYWIVTHTHSTENGSRTMTEVNNLILDEYDFENITLSKGDVLHLVFVRDQDRDGLGERSELLYGTDPSDPDTDDDGLSDSHEVNGWRLSGSGDAAVTVTSDPVRIDTDGDQKDDRFEFEHGTHPRVSDLVNSPPRLIEPVFDVRGYDIEVRATLADDDANVKSVTVDFGDGSDPVIVENPMPGELTFAHTFSGEGQYTVTLVAIDAAGDMSETLSAAVTTSLPNEGLVLHMGLDDSLDASVGTALQNAFGVDVFATDRHGLGEGALDLYGSGNADEYSLLYGNHLDLSVNFSIALWVKLRSGAFQGNTARIAGQGNWFNLFSSSTSSGVSFGVLDGLGPLAGAPVVSDGAAFDEEWHFYVGVVEHLGGAESAVRLYRDGSEVASEVSPSVFTNPGSCRFYVGNFPESDLCDDTEAHEFTGFPGAVDDLRVYERALTADEVTLLYGEQP
jgi:hypothetical protein